VLKTYELMNNSMKTIRQESDLEKAEDIMIELQENKDDLDDFSTSLHGSVGHAISDEELEEELAQLMDNDEDEFIFHESTNGNDIANTNTELKKGGVGSVAGELEEELAQLMDNDGDVGISHESTNVNDIANINTELKEGGKVNVAGDDEEIELESQSPLAV
jgi:molybdopterin converting factor small subunit